MAAFARGRYSKGDRGTPPTPCQSTFSPVHGTISTFAIIFTVARKTSLLDLWQLYSNGKQAKQPVWNLWAVSDESNIENWTVVQVASGELNQVCKTVSPITAIGPLLVIATKKQQANKEHGTINTARRCWVNCSEGNSLTKCKYCIMTAWLWVISARGTRNK